MLPVNVLVITSIEGTLNNYDKNKTLHTHIALGNILTPQSHIKTEEQLIKTIKTNWLATEIGVADIVIKKIDSTAPHNNILIIDSTTGQNSQSQVEAFDLAVKIDGLIFTKLDGTAKGGSLITIAQKFNKPIFAIGVGEKIDDLQEFDAKAFVDNILD
jgi:signal recognition particle GTPase